MACAAIRTRLHGNSGVGALPQGAAASAGRLATGKSVTCRCEIGSLSILKEHAMNWDRIEGNWKQFKGEIREQWGKLTDDDIDVYKRQV